MKKLLVVLLALGLIAAFSMTASAADVKFSGQYYVVGTYENNRSLNDTNATNSMADFYTRTRVQTVFGVAEGLSLTTRFDALEKWWGGPSGEDKTNSRTSQNIVSNRTPYQENIEFEQAYVTFNTAIGQFAVGYQDADTWGTGFGDTPCSRPRIKFTAPIGPITLLAIYEKVTDSNDPALLNTNLGMADADWDNYALAAIYKFKGGDAGLLYKFVNAANPRPAGNYRVKQHVLAPYLKATFGPVYVEGEVIYLFGKAMAYEAPATTADVDAAGWGAYVKAKMNMGPAYFGAQVGFSSGDDPTTADKNEQGPNSSVSWSPALIFGEANVKTWIGGTNNGSGNASGASFNSNKYNLLVFNVFGGFNPTPKLNIEATLATMTADKEPTNYVSDKYGTEFDVVATYKIYDNLSYMVGAGYLWTGDYFKGTNSANTVGNDYLVLNKLTLNF